MSVSDPGFSIILPVFNGGAYFKDCVRSILDQEYSNFELVILDNYSSPEECEWISGIGDSRVRHLRSDRPLSMEENWARIRGVHKREYMTIVCHDDLLRRDFLRVISGLIDDYPDASLYQTHFTLIDEKGERIRNSMPISTIETVADYLQARFAFARDSFGSAYVFRSVDYGDGIPLYKNLLYADDALWTRLMGLTYKAASPEQCFQYRLHRQSAAAKVNIEDHLDALDEYIRDLSHLGASDPDIAKIVSEQLPAYVHGRLVRLACISIRSANLSGTRVDLVGLEQIDEFYRSTFVNSGRADPTESILVNVYLFINSLPFRKVLQKFFSRLDGVLKAVRCKPVSAA